MPKPKKCHIRFNPVGRSIYVPPGTGILEASRQAGVNITAVCGGNGKCGQCRVIINEGDISPPAPQELELLSQEDLKNGYRLACQSIAQGDVNVFVPEKSLLNNMILQIEGQSGYIDLDPVVRPYNARVIPPTLDDSTADMNRVARELKVKYGLNPSGYIGALRQLPGLLRSHEFNVTAYVRDNEIIGFGPEKAVPLGIAVDLGTTKIAVCLMDLTTGRELAVTGAINPQTIYGDDLMTRLGLAIHDNGSSSSGPGKLGALISDFMNKTIRELTEKAGAPVDNVADICIVGNTAMTHLFLSLPVGQLALSPYVAADNHAIDIRARDLGISVCPGAYVHILPGIGGYVGADHVAMILATEMDKKDIITLGVDIGTNTEIAISNPEKSMIVSTSCPSGPAFEGAHVSDGMRAAKGAIESVVITNTGVNYRTIGDEPPVGLCGSGILDAIAELHRHKIINDRGRFDRNNRRVSQGVHGLEFELASARNGGKGVMVSQKDVAEIQLAKGAIKAGIESLMEIIDISHDMVKEVIISGAFGSFINLANTVYIGLLPFFENALYRQVGNSAFAGAKMALMSSKERKRSQEIVAGARYLELTTHPGFNRRFQE